jgi:hypothetical protein
MVRFKNIDTFERALMKKKKIINEHQIKIGDIIYTSDMIGGERGNCYIYFTSKSNDVKIDYTLKKIDYDHYKGYDKIIKVSLVEW